MKLIFVLQQPTLYTSAHQNSKSTSKCRRHQEDCIVATFKISGNLPRYRKLGAKEWVPTGRVWWCHLDSCTRYRGIGFIDFNVEGWGEFRRCGLSCVSGAKEQKDHSRPKSEMIFSSTRNWQTLGNVNDSFEFTKGISLSLGHCCLWVWTPKTDKMDNEKSLWTCCLWLGGCPYVVNIYKHKWL